MIIIGVVFLLKVVIAHRGMELETLPAYIRKIQSYPIYACVVIFNVKIILSNLYFASSLAVVKYFP